MMCAFLDCWLFGFICNIPVLLSYLAYTYFVCKDNHKTPLWSQLRIPFLGLLLPLFTTCLLSSWCMYIINTYLSKILWFKIFKIYLKSTYTFCTQRETQSHTLVLFSIVHTPFCLKINQMSQIRDSFTHIVSKLFVSHYAFMANHISIYLLNLALEPLNKRY